MPEYWLFDPKGEWLATQLQGYRRSRGEYTEITDGRCTPLGLRLEIAGPLLTFYREDTGAKLPTPEDLVAQMPQEMPARAQAEARIAQAEQKIEQLRAQVRSLGGDPDVIG